MLVLLVQVICFRNNFMFGLYSFENAIYQIAFDLNMVMMFGMKMTRSMVAKILVLTIPLMYLKHSSNSMSTFLTPKMLEPTV